LWWWVLPLTKLSKRVFNVKLMQTFLICAGAFVLAKDAPHDDQLQPGLANKPLCQSYQSAYMSRAHTLSLHRFGYKVLQKYINHGKVGDPITLVPHRRFTWFERDFPDCVGDFCTQQQDVTPVNLKTPEIAGKTCIKSLAELSAPSDCAVSIVTPPPVTEKVGNDGHDFA
jgi:hypothetical protein